MITPNEAADRLRDLLRTSQALAEVKRDLRDLHVAYRVIHGDAHGPMEYEDCGPCTSGRVALVALRASSRGEAPRFRSGQGGGTVKKLHKDKMWLYSVRRDLESDPNKWIVKPGQPDRQGAISKATAIESYLDRLLTSLGVPSDDR